MARVKGGYTTRRRRKKVLKLAENYLEFQQEAIERLKKYLDAIK